MNSMGQLVNKQPNWIVCFTNARLINGIDAIEQTSISLQRIFVGGEWLALTGVAT